MKKSYSHFTATDLAGLGISVVTAVLFSNISKIKPSAWLLQTFSYNKNFPVSTEKARSEFLVAPILVEIKQQNLDKLTIFSGYQFDIDKERGLKGFCDYLISKKSNAAFIESPVVALVEVKKDQDLVEAAPQCIAEMYAATIFNEKNKTLIPVIFGVITTGYEWLFLKLENKEVIIDTRRYSITDLEDLLGVWQTVINQF